MSRDILNSKGKKNISACDKVIHRYDEKVERQSVMVKAKTLQFYGNI